MNNELNKNEAWRGPLIFTMPATRFLVALNVDWLEGTSREKHAAEPVQFSTPEALIGFLRHCLRLPNGLKRLGDTIRKVQGFSL